MHKSLLIDCTELSMAANIKYVCGNVGHHLKEEIKPLENGSIKH